LPDGAQVTSVTDTKLSEWCNTFKIEVTLPDGKSQAFFEKVWMHYSRWIDQEYKGQYGLDMMRATFQAELTLHEFIPEFSPRPIATGTYASDKNLHFFLAEFVDMIEDDTPSPESYMTAVAALHNRSFGKSPSGQFGFPIPTRFGDLEQSNLWSGSWEAFWTNQMREILEREERLGGPHPKELVRLRQIYFNKVLPRYLRPLESDGRSVRPCLVHADLWPGNCRYKRDTDVVCIGPWCVQQPSVPLGAPYLREYWEKMPVSAPKEDAFNRNKMYMIRNQILLATLYPTQPDLRQV
ncbi:hypothetical protein PG997_012787, partial [Apiospora hydei]